MALPARANSKSRRRVMPSRVPPLCSSLRVIATASFRLPAGPRYSPVDHGERVDLDHELGERQPLHHDTRAAVVDALEVLLDHPVDGWAVGHVRHVDGELAHILDAAPRLLHELLNVPARLLGLGPGMALPDEVAVEIEAGLPAEGDVVSASADRHGVDAAGPVLVGRGVELPDELLRHAPGLLES